jgi:hypothetical protein
MQWIIVALEALAAAIVVVLGNINNKDGDKK